MKKLLFLPLGVIIIFLIVQKFGLLNYFSNNSKSIAENNSTNILPAITSQTNNRPIIGIHYRMIDKQTAFENNLVEGAYITQVINGSLATKANLQEEDIITEVDGNKISGDNKQVLIDLITRKKPGEKISLKIWRNKEIKAISVILETAQ